MKTALLTTYVLMWPVIAAIVLGVIATAFFREAREAKREGRDLI